MKLGWLELVRRPSRFIVAGGALTLLVILLLLLGGLLDGLTAASTGAYRSLGADVIVYSDTSRESLLRSRIEPEVRERIEAVEGVRAAHGLGVVLVGGRTQSGSEVVDLAVFGYEAATEAVPAPPSPGAGYADRSLEGEGVRLGDTLLVGPAAEPVRVIGWAEDSRYLAQASLWVSEETWRRVLETSRPDAVLDPGVWQALLVDGVGDPQALAAGIRRAVPGTSPLTIPEAILRLPGVEAQQETFLQIIGVTLVVAGLVVALFFALVVLERVGMFGMLKAIGASSRQLAAALATQAALIALGAFVVGGVTTAGLGLVIPEEVPVELRVSRAVVTGVAVLATALLGSALSLRRLIRIEPASAVGGG
jgi:putative ABC transport system permease protein